LGCLPFGGLSGELGWAIGFHSSGLDGGEEALFGFGFGAVKDINVDNLFEESGRFDLFDADEDELAGLAGGVLGECGCPFGLGVGFGEVAIGEDGDRAIGGEDGVLHVEDEVAAAAEVPGLEDDGVACFFECPGDPFCPGGVAIGVADKEVCRVYSYSIAYSLKRRKLAECIPRTISEASTPHFSSAFAKSISVMFS
jgi:hypothetical protein